jgi:hypothetical protein
VYADVIWIRGVLVGGVVEVSNQAADAERDDAVNFVIDDFYQDGGIERDIAAGTLGALGVEVG